MSQARFKIVFSGELMPDAQLDEVKANLARLFKSDSTKIASLFSGNPVALKRDLAENEAEKYLAALQRAGAKVRKEADMTASLSLVETEEHSPPPVSGVTTATDSNRMSCPKCGHEQDKAAECTACGIIIDKYLARQAELAASAPTITVTSAPPEASSPASPYAPPSANVAEAMADYAELRPFGVEGRIGRLRYLAWSLSLMAAAIAVFGVVAIGFQLSEVFGAILGILALVGMAVVSVQIGVQRLHDIGWSGWLLLVNIIPVVGSVFSLIMLVVPGSNVANRFGPPPPPNSTAVKVLSALWLLVPVVFGILAAIAIPAYQDYTERAQSALESSYDEADEAEAYAPVSEEE